MVKKISMLALAGMVALPGIAAAGAGSSPHDLDQKIEELSRDIDSLKAKLARQNEALTVVDDKVNNVESDLDKSMDENGAGKIKFSGDFRSRLDVMTSSTAAQYSVGQAMQGFGMALPMMMGQGPYSYGQIRMAVAGMKMMPAYMRAGMFQMMGITPEQPVEYNNDTNLTNRLRLNMIAKPFENITFKGRLAMYKAFGMQSNPDGSGPFTMDGFYWDGNSTRQPVDSALRVDRAYVNWTSIADLPIWFSVGRRPTTDGPPGYIRMNDEKNATPTAYMDYPFDGIVLGTAYSMGDDAEGKLRFCYGRGFEAGLSIENLPGAYGPRGLNDMDFAGFNWDAYKKDDTFLNVQVFGAYNLVNTPDGIDFPNPLEQAGLVQGNGILDRQNLGNMYHSSFVFMNKAGDLNYFLSGGWSHTMPAGYDELGNSLLGSWWEELEDKDGYSVYAGMRYDINDSFKVGGEYNWGSENWLGMTPGHDDLYNSKLAARGHVGELYMIYNLPAGDALSENAQAFIRLGAQYYKYDYSGSGSWLGSPVDVDNLATDPLYAQFFPALDDMTQVYLTFEAAF
ncbi:MAG: DUF3373 domain-containing protein [Desulfobulbaceae bacterium]|nr:DUF3373 domain-containing protein [Desulfobulbaceae bacterium]